MDRTSLTFCIGTVVLFVAISAVAYPFAAVPAEKLARAATPQPAEALGSINVGNGFGEVPVSTLMDYYISNPPAKATGVPAAAPQLHFGGC
ncbi:MAG TPA: hypothetical protein VG986_12075 [Pseudolabrys sp.]|nr:hypothetical protein [Pseudolabrys sp.]